MFQRRRIPQLEPGDHAETDFDERVKVIERTTHDSLDGWVYRVETPDGEKLVHQSAVIRQIEYVQSKLNLGSNRAPENEQVKT